MYLIIGVDPGTTTGLAAVTLDGKVHHVYSARNMGVDQVVKHITSLGRASIIASDVTPTPDSVLKIASSLGCSVFTLYEPLSVSDKNAITDGYEAEDLHCRDALAAALNVYNKYKNKLHKISHLGYGDDVKHRVLQGKPLERVLSEMKAERQMKAKSKKEPEKTQPIKTPPAIAAANNKNLEKQNRMLREQIKLNDFEISALKKKISSTSAKFKEDLFKSEKFRQQEQVIDSLDYKAKALEEKVTEIKELWRKMASGKIIPVGVYPESYSGVTLVGYRISNADLDNLRDAKLVLTEDPKNKELLSKHGIPVADAKPVQRLQDLAHLNKKDFLKMASPQAKSIESIVDEYRRQRANPTLSRRP